jgi:hypothetical protein
VAVRDVHCQSLSVSTQLSEYSVVGFVSRRAVSSALDRAGVRCVLIGTHAIGGWMQKPRTCEEVEVVVGRGFRKAVRALRAEFPDLRLDEREDEAEFRSPQPGSRFVLTLRKPNRPVLSEALKGTQEVGCGGQTVRIPSLEAGIALKYVALLNRRWSDPEKYQGAHDFLCLVQRNTDINRNRLSAIGRRLSLAGELPYPDGGKEMVDRVKQIPAGVPPIPAFANWFPA